MNIERNYIDFKIYKTLESILIGTLDYRRVLHSMPYDRISDKLFDLINRDIKTSYNNVGLSDKNDEISFIPDNQYQRFISTGADIESKTKSKIKVGRMAKQILKDNGHTDFTDSDIEKFVNSFKSVWDRDYGEGRVIDVVKGDDIKKWYNENNYNSNGGTLGNSCMRHATKSDFMSIYASNPDKISMAILTFKNKLIGRALIWQLDEERNNNEVYLDRIYTEKDSDIPFIYDWFKSNYKNSKICTHKDNDGRSMKVFLNHTKFDEYPYADTMSCLYCELNNDYKETGKGFISNSNSFDSDNFARFELTETNGEMEAKTHRYYEEEDGWIVRSNAVSIYGKGYYPRELCVECSYRSKWILKSEAVYSEYMKDWVPKDESVETEDFGIVHRDALKNCVMEYIGEEKSPSKIYSSILDAGDRMNVINKLFRFEKMVNTSDGILIHNSGTRHTSEALQYISVDISVKDIWNDSHLAVLCHTIYKVNPDDISEEILNAFSFYIRDNYWMIEDEMNAFGIKSVGPKSYLPIYRLFNIEKYKYSYKIISDILSKDMFKGSDFNNILENRKLIHESMNQKVEDYRFTIRNYKSTNETDSTRMTNEVANRIADKCVDNNIETVRRKLRDYFRGNSIAEEENGINLIVDIYKIYLKFMVASGDTGEANVALQKFIESENKKDGKYSVSKYNLSPRQVGNDIYNTFYYEFDSDFYRVESNVYEQMSDDAKVPMHIIRGFVRSSGTKSIKI